MNRILKRVLSLGLLLFAVAGGVYALYGSPSNGVHTAGLSGDGIRVYYFHGNVRCQTCRTIEEFTADAVTTGDLAEAVSWNPVNVDLPENTHFIGDFRLANRSVIVAEVKNGEVVRWKNLPQIWHLVADRDEFVSYVRDEVSDFIRGT